MSSLYSKLFLCIFLSLAVFLAVYSKSFWYPHAQKRPRLALLLGFFLLRILPFIIIFILLDFDARGDVSMFYDSVQGALQGGWVYRDFDTAYSPLFPYVISLPVLLWNSAKSIILMMILVEGVVLYLTLRWSQHPEGLFRAILYLLLPAPFVYSVLGGQEDIWMWGFLVTGLLLYQKNQHAFLQGMLMAIGLLVTKALFVLILPAIWLHQKNKVAWMAGALAIGIPALIILYSHIGLEFLEPIQQANDPRLPNIWSVLHPITNGWVPLGPKWINWLGLSTLIGLSLWVTWKLRKSSTNHFIPTLFLSVFVWLMLIQQSSLTNYSYNYMVLIPFIWRKTFTPRFWVVFLTLNFALVMQQPLWWGLDMIYFHNWNDLKPTLYALEYFLEVIVVAGLIWLLREIILQFWQNDYSKYTA